MILCMIFAGIVFGFWILSDVYNHYANKKDRGQNN